MRNVLPIRFIYFIWVVVWIIVFYTITFAALYDGVPPIKGTYDTAIGEIVDWGSNTYTDHEGIEMRSYSITASVMIDDVEYTPKLRLVSLSSNITRDDWPPSYGDDVPLRYRKTKSGDYKFAKADESMLVDNILLVAVTVCMLVVILLPVIAYKLLNRRGRFYIRRSL